MGISQDAYSRKAWKPQGQGQRRLPCNDRTVVVHEEVSLFMLYTPTLTRDLLDRRSSQYTNAPSKLARSLSFRGGLVDLSLRASNETLSPSISLS
jgi:hypothetical protein